MLRFDSASRVFADGTVAANKVDLDIPQGEFCVLLGPSGAGKSTLMGMINGLVEPSSGSVSVAGEVIDRRNLKRIQRQVGMIHQQLHLVPRLSVLHNVLAGALPAVSTARGLCKLFPRELQRRACRLLAEVEMEEKHVYRRASELSGGQQQRVAIARAFILEPKVVLADEPVASLDPSVSRQVLDQLKRASRQHNATVLCSLHQVEYALEFADRIVGLRAGEIMFDGPPDKLDDSLLEEIYDGAVVEEELPTATAA